MNTGSSKEVIWQGQLVISQDLIEASGLFHMIRAYSGTAYFGYGSSHPESLANIVGKASNVES